MFTGIYGYLIAAGVAAVISASTAVWLTHAVMAHKYDQLVIADKQAVIVAQETVAKRISAQDKASAQVSLTDAVAQQRLSDARANIQRKVSVHVTHVQDTHTCVPYGVVRVLDASVLGVGPDTLQLAPGKSDDACAPVTASDLARSVADNYAVAAQNAAQLDDLEAAIKAINLAANGEPQ
jgi:hypothetical protein